MQRRARTKRVREVAAEECAECIITFLNEYAPDCLDGLSANVCITQHSLVKHANKLGDLQYVNYNPNIDWRFIITHTNYPWVLDLLQKHKCITQDIVASKRPPFIWTNVRKNINFPIVDVPNDASARDYSEHPNISWAIVKDHLNLAWNWFFLNFRLDVTSEILTTYPLLPWNGYTLSANKHVTLALVLAHPEMIWDWATLSRHVNITLEMMEEHPELPWDFDAAAGNPNASTWQQLGTIAKKSHTPSFWTHFLQNPNITLEDIMANINFLTPNPNLEYLTFWDTIVYNQFPHQRLLILVAHARRHMAAYRLQKWWRSAISHPARSLCWRAQWRVLNTV